MKYELNFEEEPFEVYYDFDERVFDAELVDLEQEDEAWRDRHPSARAITRHGKPVRHLLGEGIGEAQFELETRSSGVWKMRPPEIKARLPHCWAAAMSSWSQRTLHLPRLGTRDYVDRVRDRFPDRVHASGALIGEQGLEALRVMFGLCLERTENQMMSLSYLKPKLRKSYVLIAFKIHPDDAMWHTVLVYGADRFSLCFMDPLRGRRRCEPQWAFGSGDPVMYVLWRC